MTEDRMVKLAMVIANQFPYPAERQCWEIAQACRKELEREYRRGFVAGIRFQKEKRNGEKA